MLGLGEHEYHLFIQCYTLSLCITNTKKKLAIFDKVLVNHALPDRNAKDGARPYLPKGLHYASFLNLNLFKHSC